MPRRNPARKTTRKPIKECCPNWPQWSISKYRTFIRSAMRKAWLKWPPRFEALRMARRPSQTDNKKQKWEFQCAKCKQWHMGKNVSVDHIQPWGHIWLLSIEEAWSRLLVSVRHLQVLCKVCHDEKTNQEKAHAQLTD